MLGLLFAVSQLPADYILAGHGRSHRTACKGTPCFCAIAQTHAFYYVLHALGQDQTNELHLWDRPHSCLLTCFTRIGAIPE